MSAYAHTSHTTKATIVSTQPIDNMSQPTDVSQPTNMSSHPMPNPYTVNPDRNMENMDMDRNPRSNMDNNLMDTDRIPQSIGDRDLKNMDRDSGIQSNPDINRNMNSDMNRNMSPNMNQNMDVNRGTQAPTNESILERDFVNEPKTHSGERIQGADTTMSADMPGATRQGDVGYNPALFPEGWNSQDKSTWSAEEKLKAKIPGTKEHKIQSNLKKLEKNENLNQGQMDQILNRQNLNQDQNLNRDDLNRDQLHRDNLNRENLNRDQNLDRDQHNKDFSSEHHSSMTTGEKIKAAIPGTKEHKIKKAEKQAEKEDEKLETRQNEHLDREIRQEQDNGFKPKDQMTTGEKIKAAIPGTKEHRAKKAIEKGDQPVV